MHWYRGQCSSAVVKLIESARLQQECLVSRGSVNENIGVAYVENGMTKPRTTAHPCDIMNGIRHQVVHGSKFGLCRLAPTKVAHRYEFTSKSRDKPRHGFVVSAPKQSDSRGLVNLPLTESYYDNDISISLTYKRVSCKKSSNDLELCFFNCIHLHWPGLELFWQIYNYLNPKWQFQNRHWCFHRL